MVFFLNLSIHKCTFNVRLYPYIVPQVIEVSLLRLSFTADQTVLSKTLATLNSILYYSLKTRSVV